MNTKEKQIEETIEFLQSIRKNYTSEADKIIENVKSGMEPTKEDILELIMDSTSETEMKRLKEYKELNEIRKKVEAGHITKEDYQTLCTYIGFDEEIKNTILNEFEKQGKIK